MTSGDHDSTVCFFMVGYQFSRAVMVLFFETCSISYPCQPLSRSHDHYSAFVLPVLEHICLCFLCCPSLECLKYHDRYADIKNQKQQIRRGLGMVQCVILKASASTNWKHILDQSENKTRLAPYYTRYICSSKEQLGDYHVIYTMAHGFVIRSPDTDVFASFCTIAHSYQCRQTILSDWHQV